MLTSTVRFNFGLPGPREQEAVIAYHFYRLLQRARALVVVGMPAPTILVPVKLAAISSSYVTKHVACHSSRSASVYFSPTSAPTRWSH